MRKIWRRRVAALSCAAFAVTWQAIAFAADSDSFQAGLEQFDYKRYHAASQCFEKAITQTPQDFKAHYYLGMCFEALKDPESAKQEYEIAFRLNPFSTQGQAARAALLNLASSVEAGKHPTDGAKEFEQAVRLIDAQSADNQARWLNWGQRNRQYRIQLGNIESGMLNRQAAMARADLAGIRGSQNLQRDMSNETYIKASYQLTDSQVQGNRYMMDGVNAARYTQESANSLKMQLSQAPKLGQPRLRALGTSLYVRNYSPFDDGLPPADPPLELRAQAKSFADLPVELKATPKKLVGTTGSGGN